VVLTLGNPSGDSLVNHGFTACLLTIPTPPGVQYDALALAKSIGNGTVRVDAIAGAVQAAAQVRGAVAVWGHRAWGLVAGSTGLPFVVEDPIRSLNDLDAERDPPWVHVPGAWQGSMDAVLSGALAVGSDANELVSAISRAQN